LNLLEQFPSVGVSALKFPPSVVVQGVFEFFRKSLNLEALIEELLMEREGFLLELFNLRGLGLDNLEFTSEITNLKLEEADIFEALGVLDLSLGKSALENLDLLIQEGKLIISSNELSSENISLVLLVSIKLSEVFIVLTDRLDDLRLCVVLRLLDSQLLVQLNQLSIVLLHLSGELLFLTLDHSEGVMLVGQGLVLPVDFILEVRNVMRSNLEFTLQFDDLILGFNAILGVQVTLGTDSFVKVLLLLHLGFVLHVLFLELSDQVFLKLDLFDHLHQVGVGLVGVLTVGVSLLLDLRDKTHELSASDGFEIELLLEGRNVGLLSVELFLVLGVGLFYLTQVLLHHVTLTDEVMNVLLLFVGLLVNPLDLTGEGRHGVGGHHLFVESLFTTRLKAVVFLVEILHITLRFTNHLLKLTDSVSAHLLFLDHFAVAVLESSERLVDDVVVTGLFIKVVAELALVGHLLLLLFIKLSDLEFLLFDGVLEILLLLLVLLDGGLLTVDVFF